MRHSHTVRGLKPLLFRCSTAALPAASQVSAYSIRTSHLTTAAAASRVLSSSPAESSSSVSDKSHWLVCLAAGAVTACVVGSSLEKAPVTERQQLLLGMYKSPPRSDPTTAMPMACALDGITAPKGTTARKDDDPLVLLNSHGDAVTEAAYVRVAKAVADLAAADPALQSRLASTPAKIQLGHYSFVLERSMGTSLSGKDDKPMPPFRNELAAAIRLAVPGGALLHQQTADEVITGLAKELAHVIANHDAESKSWSTMSCMVAAIPAALFPRRSLWSCMAASLVCWYFAKVVIIYTWLHRKHVYEADAIAAAISQAAGVSPSSVLTSMQRSYYAEATTPAKASLRLVRQQRMQWHLAKLQSLLPKSQIPAGPISDSVGMQLVIDAAASELSGASSQVQAECSKPIGILEDLLAEELCCLRHPYTAWTDIHPHWLDRIAHVENILRSASAPGQGDTLEQAACHDRDRERLLSYQQSPFWPKLGKFMIAKTAVPAFSVASPMKIIGQEEADGILSSLQAVRGMSPQSLADFVKSASTRSFSWSTYWKALNKADACPRPMMYQNPSYNSYL